MFVYVTKLIDWNISCPSVCDPIHCVNCVDSIVVSPIRTCVVMVTVCVLVTVSTVSHGMELNVRA